MRRIREILRYRHEQQLSEERIAGALGVSKGTVHNTLKRFAASGIGWPLPGELGEEELERRLYPSSELPSAAAGVPRPDVEQIEKELHKKHVTLELLWREYDQQWPRQMSRASFYRYVKRGLPEPVTMIGEHKGGDKLYVDYSGDGLHYVQQGTGLIVPVDLFVAAWGASSHTFAWATASQQAGCTAQAHVAAFEWFGCVPHALVPDNAKSTVFKSDRYEPEANPLYQKMAEHYGAVVLPARVRRPRDKATVESAVGYAQRYVLGRLRNRTFHSLAEINAAILELLVQLNNEPMRTHGGQTRRQRFEAQDKPNALPLPAQRFELRDVKVGATVGPNYHICYEKHHYSVPWELARQKVDIHLVGNLVEIYHKGRHVARHQKGPQNFLHTTRDEHMPPNHRFVRGWSKEWFLEKAGQIGSHTQETVKRIMERQRHPQQGFNSSLGVLNLARKYGPERLETACARAIHYRSPTCKAIRAILERELDRIGTQTVQRPVPASEPLGHDNIRGEDYYAVQCSLLLSTTTNGDT
jgi:transposase